MTPVDKGNTQDQEQLEQELGEELEEQLEGQDFEDYEVASSADLADAITQITERVLDTIEGASAARVGFFFPNGIDVIEVSVDIAGVKASVKIAGPKAA
ncbi:MAG: hypothetical protein QOJ99_5732 [Bryobacterales bacterium]|jgi:hypothetical protein|nr:hypothetical protein [Bryobacterales bacterium]